MKAETCNKIWNQIIFPTYEEMQRINGGLMCPEYEQNAFKIHYEDIVRHAKEQYMLSSVEVLNRHKVAAALMIAILKTKPIKKVATSYYNGENGNLTHWPLNESLAITLALSVLSAFILKRIEEAFSGKKVSKAIFGDVVKEDCEIFADGVPISEQERKEWEWELYQVRQDGAYNLLAIAHVLKEIEKNCRLEYFLNKCQYEPTYPPEENLIDTKDGEITLDSIF